MTSVQAQDIRVETPIGSATLDTGSAWLDFGFVVVILIVIAGATIAIRRFGK